MKGFKTFAFFFCVSLLGLTAWIDADHLTGVLLPLVCHVDPAHMPDVATPCVDKVVALAGKILVAVGVIGKVLRFVTTTGVFKPE